MSLKVVSTGDTVTWLSFRTGDASAQVRLDAGKDEGDAGKDGEGGIRGGGDAPGSMVLIRSQNRYLSKENNVLQKKRILCVF